MRKAMAVGAVFLAASVAFAVTLLAQSQSKKHVPDAEAAQTKALAAQITPLNLKTGLWQTTETLKVSGLPPQIAAAMPPTTTFKGCLKPEDLARDKWAKELVGYQCQSVTVLKSTGTDAVVQATGCDAGNGVTADGHAKLHLVDPGHLTGSMVVNWHGSSSFGGNGSVQTHADYTGRWIGATCPANMD